MAVSNKNSTQNDLNAVIAQFDFDGDFQSALPFGNGHIHDTFLVTFKSGHIRTCILQRINNHVFRYIPEMMRNIEIVTSHITSKLLDLCRNDIARKCLALIKTIQQQNYYKDSDNQYWRCFHYITDSHSFDSVDSTEVAFAAGTGYGQFHALIADLDQAELYETIPDFHNINSRLKLFSAAVNRDPVGRTAEVDTEIRLVEKYAEEMRLILELGDAGQIPKRVTHNDTKINNVLFDSSNKVLCVIDLDTVMPGYMHYDFGDAIRTATNTAEEDEADLQKVSMDVDLYEAFCKGFLQETGAMLTPVEIETMAFSPKLLAYIMGLRFLTDYIDGDDYYKIKFEKHNLQRARAQFKLLESMYEQSEAMERIIKDCLC